MKAQTLYFLMAWGIAACAGSDYEASMAPQEAEKASGAIAPGAPPASQDMHFKGRLERGRGGEAVLDPSPDDSVPAKKPRKRMVHYHGHLRLRVTNPTATLQQASEMVDAAGGYVEALTAAKVVLRVPVEHFRTLYARLAKIGEVLSRSMSATDVTDAFVATELRLKILKASRDRLLKLLEKAQGSRAKLRLLQEISRLSEQIDQLEMQKKSLVSLASYSRLTVEAEPHQVHVRSPGQEPIAAFRWIHRLSPFRFDIAMAGEKLELSTPQGLVELPDHGFFLAESADGAKLWASSRRNTPAGDTAFWLAALKSRLGSDYAEAHVSTVGDFMVLRLVDQSEKSYRYLVGVRAHGDDLQVVEVYFPGEEQEARYRTAIEIVVKGGAV